MIRLQTRKVPATLVLAFRFCYRFPHPTRSHCAETQLIAVLNMKKLFSVLFTLSVGFRALAQGTAFTYKGRLNDGTNPSTGAYDIQFSVFDVASNGVIDAGPLTNSAVGVSNGLFTVTLDFGNGVFTGDQRWLEISVRTNHASTFVTLRPRELLTATPYAVHAATANTVPATNISGVLPDALLSANVSLLNQSQIFTGSNFFQGPLTLTNPANTFAGQFLGNGAGLTNIPPLTSVLTTNSTMAEIKAAIAQGGLIWFQPGVYWSVDNLQLTNNTVILGWNAILHAKPGLTNFLIDEDISTVNISIYGLTVSGDRALNYTDPNFFTLNPVASPYYQPNIINHGGMRLNMASGGSIVGCSACGFGGYGFMLVSRNGSAAQSCLNSFFHDNHAYDNAVGVGVLGPPWDYPSIPYVSQQIWTTGVTDEHQLVSGNEMFKNGIGLYAPAGNCVILGNKITSNDFGIVMMSGPNNTHGEIIGNTLNHNVYGIVAVSMIGEMIRNNLLLDVNSIYIFGAQYLVLDGNQFGGGPVTITVTNNPAGLLSYVTISHNFYSGSWGTDINVKAYSGSGVGTTYVYGNRSLTVSNDTDGSPESLMEIGAAATTNYNLPGGPTLYITNGVIWKIK